MSKEGAAFFDMFKRGLVGGLNTCAIAQIEAFDAVKMKANIKVLPDNDLVVNVPVAVQQTADFYIRVPYKKGDHVVVVFAQRDIDGVLYGGDPQPSERMLAMDDAVIVGGINLFTGSLPAADANALVIGQKDGAAKITMSGGKITLVGDVDIKGGSIKLTGDAITANGEDLTTDKI